AHAAALIDRLAALNSAVLANRRSTQGDLEGIHQRRRAALVALRLQFEQSRKALARKLGNRQVTAPGKK
ncbi:hypothetical protein JCM11641_003861, partial [Rhodosporidiobolus odoratus]